MINLSDINGYANEFEFVKYLNGKRINELNPMFYDLIITLFPGYDENSIIKSWRNHYRQKSDILIKINNTIKGISIKKGIKNSVHTEPISEFIHFLIENHINKDIVIKYLKYHYADGSTNGKGSKRLSAEEYKKDNQKDIDEINKEFNKQVLLFKVVDRFIIRGTNSKYSISALIYGEVDDFIWITTKDIRKIILAKKNIYSTAVHFGPLTCQPKSRVLNYDKTQEKNRYCIQVKWYNLFDDIIEYKTFQS